MASLLSGLRKTKVDTIALDEAPAPTRSIQEIDADIKRMKERLKS